MTTETLSSMEVDVHAKLVTEQLAWNEFVFQCEQYKLLNGTPVASRVVVAVRRGDKEIKLWQTVVGQDATRRSLNGRRGKVVRIESPLEGYIKFPEFIEVLFEDGGHPLSVGFDDIR